MSSRSPRRAYRSSSSTSLPPPASPSVSTASLQHLRKLTLAGIACDIGIENRLAIENTRLLLTYATIDPARVRTLVLFLKVWAKRRRINSPYRGTLSSCEYPRSPLRRNLS